MITTLRLRNFKSWRDTGEMRLGQITALFGANSAGKSSVLQPLLLLKQTVESSDRDEVLNLGDENGLVELGAFQDVLFRHDTSAPLEVELAWEARSIKEVPFLDGYREDLTEYLPMRYSASIGWIPVPGTELGRAVVNRMAYRFRDNEQHGMERVDKNGNRYRFFPSELAPSTGAVPDSLPSPIKCYGFPEPERAEYGSLRLVLSFEESSFRRLFDGIYHLGPLRESARRYYSWSGGKGPTGVGQRGENVIHSLLASRERGATIVSGRDPASPRQTVEERVAGWLRDLDLIDSFQLRPVAEGNNLFQVRVSRFPNGPEVLLTDVGFGVSQVLPVITLCYSVPERSTIILEQPELHLHPAVQSGLADVLIDAAVRRRLQIILESHSEHLLRRLQRRLAEGTLSSAEVSLYFCSMEDGESQLTALDLDDLGNIKNWPPDFFGDEFGELAATQRARIARTPATS